jgi:polyphosphate glucokinase
MSVTFDTEKNISNHSDGAEEAAPGASNFEEKQGSAGEPAPTDSTGPFTLALDIGGTGIKAMVLDAKGHPAGERVREPTPRPATPQAVLACIKAMLPPIPFDRVSVGFPGVVVEGVTQTAPNLHKQWAGFPLQQALADLTGRPTRVLNDAGVQGLGVISSSGVELVLTLGTGMGFALYVNGRYVPNIEMAHHPFRKDFTYEDYIGNAARLKTGNRKWNTRVLRVLEQLQKTFNPAVIYIGGGNSARLRIDLPSGVKRVDNVAGLLGGIALWR